MKYEKLFEDSESWFETWERKIKSEVVKFLIGNLNTDDANKIVFNNSNLAKVIELTPEIAGDSGAKSFIKKMLQKILKAVFKQYKPYGVTSTRNDIVDEFLERFDNEQGNVLPQWYADIRKKTVEMIAKGATLSEVYEYVNTTNIGYKHFAGHIYSAYQRDSANQLRKQAGLVFCVYEGGLIKTSRDFCIEKNGLVFYEGVIAAWTLESWTGKSIPYNPFIHAGGYNCRHRFNWISIGVAKFLLRKEHHRVLDWLEKGWISQSMADKIL